MKKLIKKLNSNISLKNRIENLLMKNGNKKTGEKILTKSLKIIQKKSTKQHKKIIKLSLLNITPSLKINKKIIKKGKKKTSTILTRFIKTKSLRNNLAVKYLKECASKQKFYNFSGQIAEEILNASDFKGYSVEKKSEIQKQALLNKRYLFKYKW